MTDAPLDALHVRLLTEVGSGGATLAVSVGRARRLADGLAESAGLDVAAEAFAGTALAGLAASRRVTPERVAELLATASRLTGATPIRVALFALGDSAALQVPLEDAIAGHVSLISGASGVRDVAAWRVVPDGALTPAAGSSPTAFDTTRPDVARVFCGESCDQPLSVVYAGDEPYAVLAWDATDAGPEVRVLAERSAAALALAVERADLSASDLAQHAEVARAAKRRLARVAFDLHDGPLQDLALMRQELLGLRGRLLGQHEPAPGAVEQLADVLAIADATEADIRDLATSMMSSSLMQRPFDAALQGVVRGFALRSGIEPELTLAGDVHGLTSMERISLLRVTGEALANVREHSHAQHVDVRVTIGDSDVEAVISDDGCGFDMEAALPEAARRGSMGLLGMIERMRLMEGTWDVQSAAGAGTTITIRFARFFPAVLAAVAPDAVA